MGSVENEASLCSLAVDCFPCFRTQPLLGDVLPGVFDALFSIFMRLFFFNMRLFVQALAICFFPPSLSRFACSFSLKCAGLFVSSSLLGARAAWLGFLLWFAVSLGYKQKDPQEKTGQAGSSAEGG